MHTIQYQEDGVYGKHELILIKDWPRTKGRVKIWPKPSVNGTQYKKRWISAITS